MRDCAGRLGREVSENLIPALDPVWLPANEGAQIRRKSRRPPGKRESALLLNPVFGIPGGASETGS